MKQTEYRKYQPNDIEELIKSKCFHELLPDEKEFILEHLANEEEFNELKNLWTEIESTDYDQFEPPANIWRDLKVKFKSDKAKPGLITIWLNSISTWWMEISSPWKISVAFGIIAIISGTALLFLNPNQNNLALAYNSKAECCAEEILSDVPLAEMKLDSAKTKSSVKNSSENEPEIKTKSEITTDTDVYQNTESVEEFRPIITEKVESESIEAAQSDQAPAMNLSQPEISNNRELSKSKELDVKSANSDSLKLKQEYLKKKELEKKKKKKKK
jgi:hypothetical protein